MIEEDYVSFETAKLLKEKGFHQPVELFYSFSGKRGRATSYDWNQTSGDFQDYSCITLWMAMKWLREKYEYVVLFDVSAWGSYDWYYVYRGNRYHYEEMTFNYNEIEEAAEAAIKYCLENLI